MESIYSLCVLVIAAGVGVLIGYIIIENNRYKTSRAQIRKEQIRAVLIKAGKKEIIIEWRGLPNYVFSNRLQNFDQELQDEYDVTYKDIQGVTHKTLCWFHEFDGGLKWKDLV